MNTTTILIVDDNLDLLDLYAVWLEEAGYKVLKASSGRECLHLVEEASPDLVLLDVLMPDLDGIEVCKAIKSNQKTAAIPVINVSGWRTSADSASEGLEAGADGYLTKLDEWQMTMQSQGTQLRPYNDVFYAGLW